MILWHAARLWDRMSRRHLGAERFHDGRRVPAPRTGSDERLPRQDIRRTTSDGSRDWKRRPGFGEASL